MNTPALTTIHLCRKPLVGTVAQNALKYGTGSLNIDGTRLGGVGENLGGGAYAENPSPRPNPEEWRFKRGGARSTLRTQKPQNNGQSMNDGEWRGGTTGSIKGRWPANVIFQHAEGCELVGHHYEDFLINVYADEGGGGNFDGYKGDPGAEKAKEILAEGNGQMVEEWACVEGCPVLDLNEQSGVSRGTGGSTSGMSAFGQNLGWNQHNNRSTHISRQNDEGGASRYFKQVIGPYNLIEYLRTMLSTPDKVAFVLNTDRWPEDIASWEDGSLVGLVVRGAIQQEHVDEFMRLLPPGGHLALIAPDSQPTGHTGAILLEDAGFEIRDAILRVRGPGKLHYVAKAARKEREAGCRKLKPKKGHEAVERKEGSAGVENPRAGAGRTAKQVRNFHPTVKPIELMKRLLADVPKDQGPVLDPFMGSGTTGIACTMTGHDFVGIERDAEYLPIAEARIRHWDRAHVGWQGADIVSDLEQVKVEAPPELGLFDLLGDD